MGQRPQGYLIVHSMYQENSVFYRTKHLFGLRCRLAAGSCDCARWDAAWRMPLVRADRLTGGRALRAQAKGFPVGSQRVVVRQQGSRAVCNPAQT